MRKKSTKMIKSKYGIIAILAAVILFIASILYALADRYLIEHVVSKVIENDGSRITGVNSPDGFSSTDSTDAVTGTDSTSAPTLTLEPTEIPTTYDDWNYNSRNISINIRKVQTGSGKQIITYFAADVKIKSMDNLCTAFAKNKFGRNIVQHTSKIASNNNAIFAINGDYYGFRDDGIIIRNGTLYRDVPVRTAAALFKDGNMKTFDETKVNPSVLLAQGVIDTLSFGPILVKNGQVVDLSSKVAVDTNFGNRSIQGRNTRTGIGMFAPNHYLFIVVDGRMENYSVGMTLTQFARLFADFGCTEAYNLDGGGSSTMYFMGRVVNNPLGKGNERSLSDILYIKE